MSKENPMNDDTNGNGTQKEFNANEIMTRLIFPKEPDAEQDKIRSQFHEMREMLLDPGATSGLHWHASLEVLLYVVEGKITVMTSMADKEDQSETIGAGESHFFRNGQGHSITAGPTGARIICIHLTHIPDESETKKEISTPPPVDKSKMQEFKSTAGGIAVHEAKSALYKAKLAKLVVQEGASLTGKGISKVKNVIKNRKKK